jgi:hypothetical protein
LALLAVSSLVLGGLAGAWMVRRNGKEEDPIG